MTDSPPDTAVQPEPSMPSEPVRNPLPGATDLPPLDELVGVSPPGPTSSAAATATDAPEDPAPEDQPASLASAPAEVPEADEAVSVAAVVEDPAAERISAALADADPASLDDPIHPARLDSGLAAPAPPPAAAVSAPGSELTSGPGGEVDPGPDSVPAPDPAPAVERSSSFARDLPRVMAVANQKGGVGKTTTAVNLGACLADIGYRVLVVDLDPQGNASTGLGINIRDLQGSMYDVILHDLPIEDCVEATSVRNLFCAPSSLDLAGAEIELVPAFSRELRLKRALEEVHDDYDFVLIDCPPSLGLLTVNGLAAATEVVVPIQCEYYALEGLGQLLRNVNLVQRNLNPALELSAIILVMYDARTKLADQVVTEVRAHFGDKVCRNVVPRTVRLSEAPSFGQPIIAFDSSSRGAIAYRELAKEVSGGTPQRAR